MYFLTAALAFCVAVFCLFFSFVSEIGWLFIVPTFLAVLCFAGGIGLSIFKPMRGAWLSTLGALLCGFALIANLFDLIRVIPFRKYPGQGWLLVPSSLFLLVMIAHIATAVNKLRSAR
jgi:hypothetical protein